MLFGLRLMLCLSLLLFADLFRTILCFAVPPLHLVSVSDSRRCTQQLFASGKKKKKPKDSTIAINRLAYRNYELLETIEAGVSLVGTEVKSIRMKGSMNLRDGYIKCNKKGQSTLHNVHIAKFLNAGPYFQHEEKRVRNLLLHKHEAKKLAQRTETMPGMTIVPIKAYFSDDSKVKLQIALCRGKNSRDKRATIQARDAKREENRIIKNFRA
jgi:SsrA-binding protein